MIRKVKVGFLKIGMYVARLDRSWTETPFLFHKFQIKTSKQIEQLNKYCTYVFINTEKGIDAQREIPVQATVVPPPVKVKEEAVIEDKRTSLLGVKEIHRSFETYNQVKDSVKNILEDVKLGRSVKTEQAKQMVETLLTRLIDDKMPSSV